tara:strand:- start:4653 stop:4964 length:312 start_codon:yes stop_codon:yes gene_type:complete
MNEPQKKAFVILIFSYFTFIIAMVMNLYWAKNEGEISVSKEIFMRVLYLLFSIMAISSFVTITKENKKTKAPLTQLLFPSFLIILPVLILLGQVVSLVQVLSQ